MQPCCQLHAISTTVKTVGVLSFSSGWAEFEGVFLPGASGTGSRIQFVEEGGKVITIIAK